MVSRDPYVGSRFRRAEVATLASPVADYQDKRPARRVTGAVGELGDYDDGCDGDSVHGHDPNLQVVGGGP